MQSDNASSSPRNLTFHHLSVMHDAVLAALQPHPGGIYIDGTLGGAGHSLSLVMAALPGGKLLGIDADPAAIAAASAHLHDVPPSSYTLHHGHFGDLAAIAAQHQISTADGILFDLGVSSHQLDTPARGFSFSHPGPLDMRMNPHAPHSAADLVNTLDERALADMIYQYGEERMSRRIARTICARRAERPFASTDDLAAVVARAAGGGRGSRIHPATRTFQALRIAVNGELAQLEAALPQAVDLLRPGGRVAVISFHSLEDRIVKQFFRAESGYGGSANPNPPRLTILTKKPIEASETEQSQNPRARSARLRVAERLA